MRLKSAALFAVGFVFVSFWLHGGARCQSSAARPLSLAPPPSGTDQSSAPTTGTCHWSGLNRWCSNPTGGVLSPEPTAKGSPPMAEEVPTSPPPVILASPPTVTDDVPPPTATAKRSPRPAPKNISPPVATEDVPPRTAAAKHSPRPAPKNISPPVATDDIAPRTVTAKRSPVPAPQDVSTPTATAKGSPRSAAAKNSPPPANDQDAPAPAVANILPSPGLDNLLPTPRMGKLSPTQEPGPDGLIAVPDEDEETGQPLPIRPRPAKQSKVRQKRDIAEKPSAIQPLGDETEVEKLKPNITICRGC